MNISAYGWQRYISRQLISSPEAEQLADQVARVTVENKTNFNLVSNHGELAGLILGKFRKEASGTEEFPKVGDWVKINKLPNENKAVIEDILPRATVIARKAAGEGAGRKPQIIATNIDVLFIVIALDQDINRPLISRYLAMARQGQVTPVLILNKSDLSGFDEHWKQELAELETEQPLSIIQISAKTGDNLTALKKLITPGTSFVLVGPSGAGKSSIVNALLEQGLQEVGDVRISDGKGRHTTTKREMFLLQSGGILIDTPGIRELENLDTDNRSSLLFPNLSKLTEQCRYRNCDHDKSKGCAIIAAKDEGQISEAQYQEFLKAQRDYDRLGAKENIYQAKAQKAKVKQQHKGLRQAYKTRKSSKK